jgi:multidrug efflux pump subunit AcrA (membrane-fusion protein)
MHLVVGSRDEGGGEAGAAVAAGGSHYACPMHPEIRSDGPADCSACGMHLVLESAGGEAEGGVSPAGLAPVALDPTARSRLGLTFGTAERRKVSRTFRAPGRIVADETRIHRVIARVEGFVDQVFIPYAGPRVKRGQPLLGIYSLNLLSVQQQFLNASPSDGRRFVAPPSKPGAGADENPERGEDTQRQRLRYWDFSDEQIDRIAKSGKAENSLILVAPAGGFVTEKNALVGQKVFPGDILMVVTDLSTVWAEADVSEMDAPSVQVGMPFAVQPASLPGETFRGKVKFLRPVLDPQTHTMKVIVELPNPGLALRPGMLGSAEFQTADRECLAVPESAVLRAGSTDYAFVEEGGRLTPRTLLLGARSEGYFEVLSGLRDGERVATSATFLLDSESSLKEALRSAGGPG